MGLSISIQVRFLSREKSQLDIESPFLSRSPPFSSSWSIHGKQQNINFSGPIFACRLEWKNNCCTHLSETKSLAFISHAFGLCLTGLFLSIFSFYLISRGIPMHGMRTREDTLLLTPCKHDHHMQNQRREGRKRNLWSSCPVSDSVSHRSSQETRRRQEEGSQ